MTTAGATTTRHQTGSARTTTATVPPRQRQDELGALPGGRTFLAVVPA